MNGFEKHGIKHLSASSINLWINAPDVWVASYLFGKRTPMGAAAMRGICTEDAVVASLTGEADRDTALKAALEKFDKTFIVADEKITKERAMIEPCMDLALEALADYGKPEFTEDELLSKAKTQITRMERFLRSGTRYDIAGVIPVNPNSFYWHGGEAIREELYEI